MSKSLATKLYLKQRMQELNINEISDLLPYMDTFDEIIGDLVLMKRTIENGDDDKVLLCTLPPLLTALMSIKENISIEQVATVSLQTNVISKSISANVINKSISRKSYGNEDDNGQRWLEVISWTPRVFMCHNFLTNEECEHLISLAKPNMVRSKVTDATGKSIVASWRTSTGTFLRRGHDVIVKEIERKISEFTFMPIENGEGLQIINYEVGQRVGPHYDGHNRIVTVLMYLSDVEEGGETVFPQAKGYIHKGGLSVSPKKGDALVFWNLRPDGSKDFLSQHGGSPIIKGNKWACTKWFRHHDDFMPINKM